MCQTFSTRFFSKTENESIRHFLKTIKNQTLSQAVSEFLDSVLEEAKRNRGIYEK